MDAATLINQLKADGLSIATAESCTGGLLAAALTAIPGSSDCFGYGLITYSNIAKQKLLQVPDQVLSVYGAVSEQTARAMALGLKALSQADIALSITGIAGPGGATELKPVGLVYIGLATATRQIVQEYHFHGDREAVRKQTVAAALALASHYLETRGE